jgi:hypothetical protein
MDASWALVGAVVAVFAAIVLFGSVTRWLRRKPATASDKALAKIWPDPARKAKSQPRRPSPTPISGRPQPRSASSDAGDDRRPG